MCRYKQGRPLSVLDGVPYTIIDGIDALPYPTTAGTSFVRSPLRRPEKIYTLLQHTLLWGRGMPLYFILHQTCLYGTGVWLAG